MSLKVHYKDPKAPTPTLPLTPGVCAVIRSRDDQILLHRRVDNGLWILPGGKMKMGESIAQCCKREIKEELDMQMDINKVVGIYTSPNYVLDFGGNKVFQPFVVAFLCTPKSKKFRINKESTEAKWFNIDKISELDLFPNTENIINQALNKKQTHFD